MSDSFSRPIDDLKPVGAGRKELADELESIESEIKNHLMDEPVPGDRYSQRMLRFVADARDRIEALNDRRIMAEATYNDVLRYFGEDPTTTSNVFFGIFKTFVISYKVSGPRLRTYRRCDRS
jgi:cytokinesis protein